MKLLVGLGNPGEEYARNRHNIGFMAVERIAEAHRFGPWKKKFQALAADGEINGEKVLLLKPQTFMNLSGQSVSEASRFLKIAPADIIVVHDELDLAPGKLKAKLGGGNAGHNGLKSISQHIGNEYVRVRLGIGHPGSREAVAGYVLHDFAKSEQVWLGPLLDAVSDRAGLLVVGKVERFVSDVTRALEPEKTDKSDKPDRETAKSALPRRASTDAARDEDLSARPAAAPSRVRHPAGERAGKRQSAIAENLRKWLAAKDAKD